MDQTNLQRISKVSGKDKSLDSKIAQFGKIEKFLRKKCSRNEVQSEQL